MTRRFCMSATSANVGMHKERIGIQSPQRLIRYQSTYRPRTSHSHVEHVTYKHTHNTHTCIQCAHTRCLSIKPDHLSPSRKQFTACNLKTAPVIEAKCCYMHTVSKLVSNSGILITSARPSLTFLEGERWFCLDSLQVHKINNTSEVTSFLLLSLARLTHAGRENASNEQNMGTRLGPYKPP